MSLLQTCVFWFLAQLNIIYVMSERWIKTKLEAYFKRVQESEFNEFQLFGRDQYMNVCLEHNIFLPNGADCTDASLQHSR